MKYSQELENHFNFFEVNYVCGEENSRVNLLSKYVSTKNSCDNKTIIQETLLSLNMKNKIVNSMNTLDTNGWMTPIVLDERATTLE